MVAGLKLTRFPKVMPHFAVVGPCILTLYFLHHYWAMFAGLLAIITAPFILYWFRKCRLPFGRDCFRDNAPAVLVALGSGGHTREMLTILEKIPNWNEFKPIYVMARSDAYSLLDLWSFEARVSRHEGTRYLVERVTRPKECSETRNSYYTFRCLSLYKVRVFLKCVRCYFEGLRLLVTHRPKILLVNGPSTAVPIVLASRSLNMVGLTQTDSVFVESIARVRTLSLSGRLLANWPDHVFGSWPEMCQQYGFDLLGDLKCRSVVNTRPNLINEDNNKRKTALVTVGSTQFAELTRLALSSEFLNALSGQGITDLVVQVGGDVDCSTLDANSNERTDIHVQIRNMIPATEFSNLLKHVKLLITHAGAGTLLQALSTRNQNGTRVIVVPNEELAENHQWELAEKLESLELIQCARVNDLVDSIRKQKLGKSNSNLELELSSKFQKLFHLSTTNQHKSNSGKLENQFSIVIPCGSSDLSLLSILMSSLQRFLRWQDVHMIYVVTPSNSTGEIQSTMTSLTNSSKIRVIDENEVIPNDSLTNCETFPKWKAGWFKQQLVKLGISSLVRTSFYLVLDSDCILIRSLGISDLVTVTDGSGEQKAKAWLQTEPAFRHSKWWKGSARILGLSEADCETLLASGPAMGVTPQVLSVDIVQSLCQAIEASCSSSPFKSWHTILSCNRVHFPVSGVAKGLAKALCKMSATNLEIEHCNWTEYGLYYLFAIRSGLLHEYHMCKENVLANYETCAWEVEHSFDWNPFKRDEDGNGFFTIFQSNLNLGPEIPRAFWSQYEYNGHEPGANIACVIIVPFMSRVTDFQLQYAVDNFHKQTWPAPNRQLIVCYWSSAVLASNFAQSSNGSVQFMSLDSICSPDSPPQTVLASIMSHLGRIGHDFNFIASWPLQSWSSPYRLAIQYNAFKSHGSNYVNLQASASESMFCSMSKFFESDPPFESELLCLEIPHIMLNLHKPSGCPQATQALTSPSYFCGPRMTRRVYVLSSELEFIPVVGGINTWLRILMSQLVHKGRHSGMDIEFVFCGLKCGARQPEIPSVCLGQNSVQFRWFGTRVSSNTSSLKEYFGAFSSYSGLFRDLQHFGGSALEWIQQDCQPRDVLMTTIAYECRPASILPLLSKGVKLVHTVHSLVPHKLIQSVRTLSRDRLNCKELISHLILVRALGIGPEGLLNLGKTPWLRRLLPNLVARSLEIESFLMKHSTAIFVPSTRLANDAARLYPSASPRIQHVPWGLPAETNVIGDEVVSLPLELESRNVDNSSIIHCLSLCKLSAQKGLDLLLDAFKFIETLDSALAKRLQLNICGDMSYHKDSTYMRQIEDKVISLKFVRVNFCGWVAGAEKQAQLRQAHLFLSTALTEPFGFSLLEAMSYGVPVVALASEGPSDIVREEFGRLVRISDDFEVMSKELGTAVLSLSSGTEKEYEKMRNEARACAKRWNTDPLLNGLIKVVTRD